MLSRLRRRLRPLAVALLLLGAALGVAEAAARWGLGLGSPPLYQRHAAMEYLFRPDQDLWRFHNRIRINRYGMRSEPLPPSPAAATRRILVFGDSVVFGGSQLDQSVVATEVLRRRLEGRFPEAVEVGNVSAGSWGPGNWLGWVRTHGLLGATDVVLVISSHDIRDNPTFGPLDEKHPTVAPSSALEELFGRYLWNALKPHLPARLAPPPPPLNTPDPHSPQALEQGKADLEAFIRLVLGSGARLRVVQYWERLEVETGTPLPEHQAIAGILQRYGVPAVQSGPIFRRCSERAGHRYDDVIVDEIHPFTARGQACLATAIEAALALDAPVASPSPRPSR